MTETEVFVVVDGEYSDYHIVGIFSTLELAQVRRDAYKANNIEIWRMDATDDNAWRDYVKP